MAFGLDDILGAGLKIIEKIIPDPQKKAEMELELFKMKQAGDFKEIEIQFELLKSQIETNKIEASSGNIFIAGWRPAAGWVCVIGLLSEFLIRPYALAFGIEVPSVSDVLFELLFGMLGLAGFRTFEKFKGVAR